MIFVISLPTAGERRESISKQFSAQQLPFQFVDPLPLPPDPRFAQEVERIAPYYLKGKLRRCSDKEISCALSHYLLWEKCVQDNLDFILVMEDDVVLSSEAGSLLLDLQWLQDRQQNSAPALGAEFVLRLETDFKKNHYLPTAIPDHDKFRFLKPTKYSFGTGGYLISRQACIKLLQLIKEDQKQDPVDMFLFCRHLPKSASEFVQILQLSPAILIQSHLLSKRTAFTSSLADHRNMDNRLVSVPRRWEKLIKLKAILPRLLNSLIKKYLRKSQKPLHFLTKYYTPWLK